MSSYGITFSNISPFQLTFLIRYAFMPFFWMLRGMCGDIRSDMIKNDDIWDGESDIHSGQIEGGETEMVKTCEEEIHRCPS